jgi:membrane-associated phospholipid phosphatase
MSHFVLPPIVMGALWATSRYQWWRFMKRFASVLVVACLMFIVLPAAPPWMAADRGLIDPIVRQSGRGFSKLGLSAFATDWQLSTKWGNAVAAMPSLHAGFAMIVPAFFLPWLRPRWLKALVLVFPVMMLTSLVYFGEHWVIDGIAGFALVGASFWLWRWHEDRTRARRADRARLALGPPGST